MWIVKFGNNTRHSAWSSKNEAKHQVEVLINHGMIKISRYTLLTDFIEFDDTVSCENGHYYV